MSTTAESPAAPPIQRFEIPSLEKLTAPDAPKVDGLAPSNPLQNPPVENPPAIPPAAPPEEKNKAPTTIMPDRDGNEQPNKAKTNSDFAKERQDAKKAALADVERARDEAIAEATKLRIEREQAELNLKKLTEEHEQLRTVASTREKDLQSFDERYLQTHGGNFSPQEDKELVQAHTLMMTTLKDNMPPYVAVGGEQKRIMFDQIIANPVNAVGMENVLLNYAVAVAKGDQKTMDLAVNSVCQLLGAEVDIIGMDDPRNKALTPDDPFFRDVERSMKLAVPSLQKKADRSRYVQENAPLLAEQRFETRTTALRQQINNTINIPRETIAARLQANPNDTVAVFASIVQAVPALKDMVEAQVIRLAEDAAAIPDNLAPRPMKGRDKLALAEHRKAQDVTRTRLSEDLVYAIIGRSAGPIFTSLIASRDEALARAGAASLNTNPGPGGGGGDTKPIPAVAKPNTQIMPPRN